MPQPTVEQIRELTDEWGTLELQVNELLAAADKAIAPVTETYNVQVEGIQRKYDKKIAKIHERQEEILAEVVPVLDRKKKDYAVEGEIAIAERKTERKVGPRNIDPETFYKKANSLGRKMWGCLTVGIKAAEDLIGKKAVDAIATKPTTDTAVVRLRLKEED